MPEDEPEILPELPASGKRKKKAAVIEGAPLAVLLQEVEKQYGAGVLVRASRLKAIATPRIQTTVFPFDLALGGGIPAGRISLLSGAKGSGKTTVSLKTVARFQQMTAHLDPAPLALWVDVEGVYNEDWARVCGVDLDRLYVSRPSFAEQAIDVFCSMLSAKEIEFLVMDSIAALVPAVEIEKSAMDQQQGKQAQLVGKMVRRVTGAMNEWAQRDAPRTIIYINQLRQKIGGWAPAGMTPEVEPGGLGQIFAASVTVRFKRIKYEYVQEADRENGVGATTALNRFDVRNSKVSTPGQTGEFRLLLRDYGQYRRGDTDDLKLVMNRTQALGYLRQDSGQWVIGVPGERVIHAEPTKQKMLDAWLTDKLLYARVQADVIAMVYRDGLHGAPPDTGQGDSDERSDSSGGSEAEPE